MLFNATHAEETRVCIVDGQQLIDVDIETFGHEQKKSNIYKGIITRIEPSLEACFVDYGEERHGFLPFKEVSRSYFKEGVDVRTATIREALSEGQELIVQVEKEERGNKGAALTTFVSLAGRYLVLMPNNPRGGGVSRRIEGEERQELRQTMDQLDLPHGMSTIARTAGIGRTIEELQWDLNYLLKLWDAVSDAATPQYSLVTTEGGKKVTHYVQESTHEGKPLTRANPAPFLILEESNLVIRAIRDYFQPDIGEILVDTESIYEQARQFMSHVMPDMVGRVKRYQEDTPLFSRFQVEHQIETAYSRTVSLPSGGAIVIDHTEALVAVDVNSARATRGSDIEETAFRTNCEAADEVARQMRLRDLGGLIVIDFIDMADMKNQRAIEQRMKDAIRPDRARVQISKISRFGLLELSRQRLRPSLSEGNYVTCPRCNGVGVIRDTESCALQVLRILQEEATKDGTGALHAQVPVDVATFLLNEKRADVAKLEQRYRVPIVLIPNTFLETPHYHIERLRSDDERLEDEVASYKRAEELTPVADDPYALKSNENKHENVKQVPVIKNFMPDVAPKHEEPAPAKSEGLSLLDRILGFLNIGKSQAKPEEKRRERREHGRRRNANNSREERSERGERRHERKDRRESARREKVEQATPQVNQKAIDPAESSHSEERRSTRRQRRPRREEQRIEESVSLEAQNVALASPSAPESQPAPEAAPANPATETLTVQATPVMPETSAPVDVDEVNAALDMARLEERHTRRRPRPQSTETPVETSQTPDAAGLSDAPENDTQPMLESDNRRRRPRRRRPVKSVESVQVIADAPVAATPVVQENPVTATTTSPAPESVEAPQMKKEEAPVAKDITEGLSENLKNAGLVQVGTDKAYVSKVSYEPEKVVGRPRPVLPPIEEEPLVQVQTKPTEEGK